MGTSTPRTAQSETLLRLPKHPVAYVALLMAVIAGGIKLLLSPIVPDDTLRILFFLDGLGFLAGLGVFLTIYWRRELYLVAALYALVTILALFMFEGVSVEAFNRMQGECPGA